MEKSTRKIRNDKNIKNCIAKGNKMAKQINSAINFSVIRTGIIPLGKGLGKTLMCWRIALDI